MMWQILIGGMLLGSVSTSPAPSQGFVECQREYDELIGELIASAGMPAASITWMILFNSLDLNNNQLVSASEIVLKLNNEHLVTSKGMENLLPEAQLWINAARSQDGDRELNLAEFKDVVGETIGRIERAPSSNRDWISAVSSLCNYFNQNIPEISEAIKDLSNCTYALRKQQIASAGLHSSEVVVNVWKGTFRTMDMDGDSYLSHDELAQVYLYFHPDSSMSASRIAKNIEAFLKEDLLDQPRFLQAVTVLLFGSTENQAWLNVTSAKQLRGKELLCSTLHSARNDVMSQLQKNQECINLYSSTLNSVLDKDKFIATDYIFTVADANKNGKITLEELDAFSTEGANDKADCNIALLFDQKEIIFNSKNMTNLMPDGIALLNSKSGANKLELSTLSCNQHKAWNAFCLTTVRAITNFPVAIIRSKLTTEESPTTEQPSISNLLAQLQARIKEKHITLKPEVIRQLLNSLRGITQTINPTGIMEETKALEMLTTTPVTPMPVAETTLSEEIQVETTQENVHTTSQNALTSEMTTSKVDGISEVVRDVINDLKSENDTGAGGVRDKEMKSLLEQLNTTAEGESKSDKKLTKEERELYDLLEEYRNDKHMEQNTKSTPGKSEQASHDVSSEEVELQELLEKAIIKQKLD